MIERKCKSIPYILYGLKLKKSKYIFILILLFNYYIIIILEYYFPLFIKLLIIYRWLKKHLLIYITIQLLRIFPK